VSQHHHLLVSLCCLYSHHPSATAKDSKKIKLQGENKRMRKTTIKLYVATIWSIAAKHKTNNQTIRLRKNKECCIEKKHQNKKYRASYACNNYVFGKIRTPYHVQVVCKYCMQACNKTLGGYQLHCQSPGVTSPGKGMLSPVLHIK